MTELGTFGAVVGFAIELEKHAVGFYQGLEEAGMEGAAAQAAGALSRAHKKRQQLLEQMRRENVTEMILEPIHGLHREEWLVAPVTSAGGAVALERHIAGFCLAAAEKVSIPQVARQFRRLAAESETLEAQARQLA
ncbi:MAG: hypothetical protein ACYC5O_17715 [Anaerolineae bacterium]